MELHLIGCDTETGGALPAVHALLSIHACTSWGGAPFAVYITPESQPGKIVDPEAAAVNGYTPEKWKERGAIDLETAMGWFRDWVNVRRSERSGAKVVCHHLAFDKGFLEEGARVAGITDLPMRYDWRCSLLLFAELMDDELLPRGSASLERLGELCGLWPIGGRPAVHEGGQDAEAAMIGYQYLKKVRKQAEETLRTLYTNGILERRYIEDALRQIAVWYENGKKEGRPETHMLEEMTCLAKDSIDGPEDGAAMILAERWRQIFREGYDPMDDDRYINGELRDAAIAYAMVCDGRAGDGAAAVWPWAAEWWKPRENAILNLRRAGALIAAEIDRHLRAESKPRQLDDWCHGKEGGAK